MAYCLGTGKALLIGAKANAALRDFSTLRATASPWPGYFAFVHWTNIAAEHCCFARYRWSAGQLVEADTALRDAQELMELRIADQPGIGRFRQSRNWLLFHRAMVAYLSGRNDVSRRHYSSVDDPSLPSDSETGWDPYGMHYAHFSVLCPFADLRDLVELKRRVSIMVTAGTSDPHWWVVRALCDYRTGDLLAARQCLHNADRYWRAADPMTELVRLLVDPGGLPSTPEDLDTRLALVLGPRKHLPLEAAVLRNEILTSRLGVPQPEPFDSSASVAKLGPDSTEAALRRPSR